MSNREWLVLGAGAIMIIWLNWYFLFATRRKPAQKRDSK